VLPHCPPPQNWEASLKDLLLESLSHVEVVKWAFVYRRLVSHYVCVGCLAFFAWGGGGAVRCVAFVALVCARTARPAPVQSPPPVLTAGSVLHVCALVPVRAGTCTPASLWGGASR
jgi:hypothetical protein